MRSFADMKQEIDAHYPLYINGAWVEGEGGERLEVVCHANGEKLCTISAASLAPGSPLSYRSRT